MELFLLQLFKHKLCCCLSGTFVTFLVGVFESFRAATLYIALKDTPSESHFSSLPERVKSLHLEGFNFRLLEAQPHLDVFSYILSRGDFHIVLMVFKIDSTTPCGPHSNIDFVHFLWRNFEHFTFKKIA